MSWSGEEPVGTLPYRAEPRKSPRLSLFHLKLTDSAQRCLRDFQRTQTSGTCLPKPVITFQGNQGYIKIPCLSSGSDDKVRVFAFYLSRESKDKPQSSFECIRQSTSWSGVKHLSCIGSIQDKITVCATDESYQLTRDRVSQVEKETWSRAAIEIKPEASHRNKYGKIPCQNNVDTNKEESPSSDRPPVFLTPAAKKCNRITAENRPLLDWLIHLLALKPHKKQDIILRLERTNGIYREQKDILTILDMVGQINPKDGRINLREEFYIQVRADWLGYSPEERVQIVAILSRKHLNISASRNIPTAMPAPSHRSEPAPPSYSSARSKLPEAKRPAPAEKKDSEKNKKAKTLHVDNQHKRSKSPPVHKCSDSSPVLNSNSRQKSSPETCPQSVPKNHSVYSLQTNKKQSSHRSSLKSPHREIYKETKSCETRDSEIAKSRESKRSECNKEQKREHDSSEEEEEEEDDWEEEAVLLERCLCTAEEKTDLAEPTSPKDDIADYFKQYSTIISEEQRQMYEKDFTADYTEYLELHAKIGRVLQRFVHLGSKMKKLQQGTVEHKMVETKILTEYKKFKKTYPGYREEKARCEYLHHKLSHIKELILEYEKNSPT
ncbi:hypothetical protein GDO86_006369 [Hymenochirus boettgeri]|uniref:OCEL domain-containing protein n=1 Tax=Hymenochirus boettgeri TaxID=247094 RepID=A0A8T2J8A4_9PIPI|nr:hypothetical protein GDO86_006369 [Hymenochirus boettgeri]